MLKGKFAVLSLAAAALLCLQVAGVNTVNSGIVHPCNSTASSASGVRFACPQSDGDRLDGTPGGLPNLTISITVKDNTNTAIPGIPAQDFWVKGCNNALVLCGGSGAINATGASDSNGQTTIAGDLAAGGCDTGLNVVVQGVVLGGGACPVICLGIAIRTADTVGPGGGPPDLKVDVLDFAQFGQRYPSPPKVYNACADYVTPFGTVNVQDFAKFGAHYNHQC